MYKIDKQIDLNDKNSLKFDCGNWSEYTIDTIR